jgi:hypothetical protein
MIGALVAASPLWAAAAVTGPIMGQAAFSPWQTPPMRTVQGRVERVSPDGNTVTLVGGMTLAIPSNISAESLKPGAEVTIAYRAGTDGQKEMTAFWIDVGPDDSRRN